MGQLLLHPEMPRAPYLWVGCHPNDFYKQMTYRLSRAVSESNMPGGIAVRELTSRPL